MIWRQDHKIGAVFADEISVANTAGSRHRAQQERSAAWDTEDGEKYPIIYHRGSKVGTMPHHSEPTAWISDEFGAPPVGSSANPVPLDGVIDRIAHGLSRVPRWLPPVNVAAVSILAWWTAFGLERSSGGSHIGSTTTALFGAVLTLGAAVLVRALERADQLHGRLEQAVMDAEVDPLTGLPERKAITVEIEARLGDQRGDSLVGVLFCDLDRLKVVNDSLGHEAGDQVLRTAADRIRETIRADDAVGRFAGDKFVVVTGELRTQRDLELLAERLVSTLSEPIELAEGSTEVVSASVGIAWAVPGDVDGLDAPGELIRNADSAMQMAKSDGGAGFATFDPTVRARSVARLELEQDLRRGIKQNELVVHYQPIVDVTTGDAERYEALIRWNHPVRGMIHPADFLSVAAESVLIVDIGNLVLREACHQAVRWSEMTGRQVTVAVNMAERQLLDPGLVGSVTRALAESGLAPHQLELEITEELIMERLDRALLVLRQLELAGVKLGIDDFGTSQASLARLQNLAMVSTLKIDRIFVEGVANESIDRNVVTAIVALASDIEMSIVAEGVETQEQATVLKDLGVHYQQGFLHQRPGPPEMMTRYLERLQNGPAETMDDETFDAAVIKTIEAAVADGTAIEQ